MPFKQRLIFSLLMSVIMGSVMSFVMTYSIQGFSHDFPATWLEVGLRSSCIAFPAAFLVSPIGYKITDFINSKFKHPTPLKHRIIFSIIMPGLMDLIMSYISTLYIVGLNKYFIPAFLKAYINGWLTAIPLVFFIAPLMMKITKKLLNN